MPRNGLPVDDISFHAVFRPSHLAAVELEGGQQWTYSALDRDVGACAAVLLDRGINPGDRVAAIARNSVFLIILHHACARIGAVFVPLNWRLAEAELQWVLEDADPKLLVQDDRVDRCMPSVPIEGLANVVAAAEPVLTGPVDPEAISLILYTSGTSGRPKGVMLSERAIGETAINLSIYGDATRDSRFLCDSPMFHVIGIISNVRTPLMRGGAVLVSDGFEAAQTLARIADPGLAITHYFGVPQMAAMLRAQPGFDPAILRRLTAFFTGGAPHAPVDILRWAEEGVPISNGFGMSECGTFSHTPLDPSLVARHAGSVGLPTPRVRGRIVDEAGCNLPAGMAGELQISGANLFSGYWRQPEATALAMTEDGWFRTGDIARFDEGGFLWIVDRKKDMYISGGENVYPSEVEAAAAGLDGLAEAAVIGVPDETWGEVGHLVAAPQPGATLTSEAILSHLEHRLARYKLPRHVSILGALPRNGAGKVLKAQMKEMLAQSSSDPDQAD